MFSIDELNKVMRMDVPRHKVVPFHPAHLFMCELNEFDKKNIELFDEYREYLQTYAEHGHAFTAIGDEDVYAMFGLWELWPGVGEAWLIPSAKIDRKTIAMHRAALRFFEYAANKMQIKRLQFTVCTLNVRADRWAQRCYFEREGLLRRYGPDGSDYWMYSRMF